MRIVVLTLQMYFWNPADQCRQNSVTILLSYFSQCRFRFTSGFDWSKCNNFEWEHSIFYQQLWFLSSALRTFSHVYARKMILVDSFIEQIFCENDTWRKLSTVLYSATCLKCVFFQLCSAKFMSWIKSKVQR